MAKGYWAVRVDITDQQRYKLYMAANAAPIEAYGARWSPALTSGAAPPLTPTDRS